MGSCVVTSQLDLASPALCCLPHDSENADQSGNDVQGVKIYSVMRHLGRNAVVNVVVATEPRSWMQQDSRCIQQVLDVAVYEVRYLGCKSLPSMHTGPPLCGYRGRHTAVGMSLSLQNEIDLTDLSLVRGL